MRLALISDIHEDYCSLKEVLAEAGQKGYDALVCLGDISGYSRPFYSYRRDAPACLGLIREKCSVVIPGNHDLHACGRIPAESRHSGLPYWPHEEDLDPGYSEQDLAYLLSLPEYAVLPTDTHNILLSHYAYPNLSGSEVGFYSREIEFEAHFRFMSGHDCSIGFTGHAHPHGYYLVSPARFRRFRRRSIKVPAFPALVGVPPVTRHGRRTGFIIFDNDSLVIKIHR